MVSPMETLQVDGGFVSRLILGALSEHEQRRLALRLLQVDSGFRVHVLAFLEPFQVFDSDLLAAYDRALQRQTRDPDFNPQPTRRALLEQYYARAPDLGSLIRAFTYGDVLRLGETTRRLFSWTMAEFLLARASERSDTGYNSRTHLYLALMVIDVVEILGVVGHSPAFPAVAADVRRRIRQVQRAIHR